MAEGEDKEETRPGVRGQNSAEWLHTGDLVLLKCHLHDDAFDGESANQQTTGYLRGLGMHATLEVEPIEDIEGSTMDVRDFIFVVVEQLSYNAQKDLQKQKKRLNQLGIDPNSAHYAAQLRSLEERANMEAEVNLKKQRGRARPICFGEPIQLQHFRTQRYVRVRAKAPASLQAAARLVELQEGNASCWWRVVPYFKHKTQGDPISLNEQVLLESSRLGSDWNLNWSRCRNLAKDEVLEVNCLRHGRNFYPVLYSRNQKVSVHSNVMALTYPDCIRLFYPHLGGFISASCSDKRLLRLRRYKGRVQELRDNAKDIWIVQPVAGVQPDKAVQWATTQVMLRHLGSKKYLAIKEHELVASGLLLREHVREKGLRSEATIRSELVNIPGPLCHFVLEPTGILEAQAYAKGMGGAGIPKDKAAVMLKWSAHGAASFWLSCTGAKQGKGSSLELVFSTSRLARDSFVIENMEGTSFLADCEVVNEHRFFLQRSVTPRCADFGDVGVAGLVCNQCEHALTDMIFFLTDSRHWRQEGPPPDPLNEPWLAVFCRQHVSHQMKYIDTSFQLFHELVKRTDMLVAGDVRWGRKAAQRETKMHAREALVNSSDVSAEVEAWEEVMSGMVATMKTRCLKLLVRLWLCSFLGSRKIEAYFHKKGWLDVLNTLNGFGLGASDVFVKLVSNNAELARTIDRGTLLKLLDLIRQLGPLDTWFYFLKAVCAPLQTALPIMQQHVLRCLVFGGQRTPIEEARVAERNRTELLVSVRLGRPTGTPLGQASSHITPLEKVLGHHLITEGICDILISWTYPNSWVAGQGALFHGPDALGMKVVEYQNGRAWVSLCHLAWVLQPQQCCEVSTGITWDEMQRYDESLLEESKWNTNDAQGAGQSRLQLLKTLAKYFLAQLRLLEDMVKERQMNCIMALQQEYSFSLCLCGAYDPRLPMTFRAAFFDLLMGMWLDRYPHAFIAVPALMRSFDPAVVVKETLPAFDLHELVSMSTTATPDSWSAEHAAKLSEETRLFYQLGTAHKMECVLRAVRKHICAGLSMEQLVHGQPEETTLLLSVLNVLRLLQGFGFLPYLSTFQELQGPLLRCLDGRTDLLNAPQVEQQMALVREELAVNVGSPVNSAMGSGSLTEEAIVPLLRSSEEVSMEAYVLTKEHFPPLIEAEARYKACDESSGIMACKVQLLKTVLFTARVGMHTKISHVLELFRSTVYSAMYSSQAAGNDPLALPDEVVESVLRIIAEPVIDLTQPYMRSPAVMCVDLMMYESQDIFALALELLFAHCCQGSELMSLLDKVELLTTAQDKLFSILKHDVFSLGRLLYSIENWGVDDDFSTMDNVKLKQYSSLCKKLRNLCVHGDSSSSPFEVQKMLHETEFFSHVDYTLKMNMYDFPPSSEVLVKTVISQMCHCAVKAVANNSKNQMQAYKSVGAMKSLVSEQPECALLLAEIFKGNFEICRRVPEDLIEDFSELILRERSSNSFVSCYIDFYMAIVSAGNKPVVRNQVPVVEALQRGRPDRMLHLLRSNTELERALDLARHFKSKSVLRGEDTSELNENDQELAYYLKSLELLGGLARGRGSHSLITKPFVAGLIHPTSAIRQLLRTSTTRERRPRDLPLSPIAVAHLTMASRWLELVRHLAYDVDVNLRDVVLLASPLHVEFVRALLDWTRASLEAPARLGGPEVEEVLYFRNLILCIDAFFSFCYTPVRESDTGEGMSGLANDYYAYFGRVMQMQASVMHKKSSNAKRWSIAEEEAELLNIAGSRVLQITSGEGGEEIHAMSLNAEVEQTATSETEAQWRAMLVGFRLDPRVAEGISREDEDVGRIIIEIGALTDPDRDDYTRFLPTDPGSSLPDGVDFRRNIITCEDVLKQIMQNQVYLRSDLECLRRVQRLLLGMLASARKSSDPLASVQMVHKAIVESGLTQLIVQMLDDQIFTGAPEDVTDSAWQLLIEVLCEVRTSLGGQSVSKPMQQSILEVCMTGVDAGMFESFREITTTTISKSKAIRSLKLLPTLNQEEQRQIDEYIAIMQDAVRAMEAMRLMVEGHFFPMQQHLHSQSGSSRSCDVLELACRVVVQIAKDPKGGDSLMPEEIQCISQALTLLIELCQGPNLQNQEVVSTLGLVETSSRLLQPRFELICQLEGDIYPPTIRRLKSLLVDGMLALVEGRLDSQIHVTIPQRLDPMTLKERIEFVHSYFVFGIVGVARRTVESEAIAAIPIQGNTKHLLSSSVSSPSDLYHSLLSASILAEELLEDLSDADIRNFFSEGLKMVQLILEVSPYSSAFENIVKPMNEEDETFIDDASQFLSEKHYLHDRSKFHNRARYRLAYSFLSRFVRTIEVMMDGNLHYLHFCLPVTAMWYVYGEAKQNILDTVPFASPDIKARYFIKKCITLHRESKLIKDLSRFSVVPPQLLKVAQRTIPDWMHRPFQIFLCDDAKNMSRLLRSALFLGLALSVHTGVFLVPDDEDDHGHAKWSSPRAELFAHFLSCLYFTCTALWLLLTVAIKLPIVMYDVEEEMRMYHPRFAIPRVLVGTYAFSRLMRDGHVTWRILLLLCCFTAFTFRHYWLNSFILMDFWCQSAVLATVFRAIASPLKSLAMTFLGLLIITFVYAAIGFRFFREDFHHFCDESILICTENILYQGTRQGIVGLSPMMSSTQPGQADWTQRVIYDMSYFIIFGVIVLNTVVGLIVDSFGALRLDMEARENDQQTQTFISCIDRRNVEQVAQSYGIPDGFEFHESKRQNKWDYMAFIFHLSETALEDLTGPEYYIRHLMDKGDAKWFPIGRSKFLEGTSMGMNQQDRFQRIQEQSNYLSSFVEANQDSWKSISRTMSQLSSAIREKLENMLTELRDLQLELKQQRMLKELQAEQGTTL